MSSNHPKTCRKYRALTLGVMSGMLLAGCKPSTGGSESPAGEKPGEKRSFAIGHGETLEFRWAPAGRFMTGGHPAGPGGSDGVNERSVLIADGFWIAENEITVATWQKVMGSDPAMKDTSLEEPVAQVSWSDCRNFLKRVKTPASGWNYDLPSEAQWEYACRAGLNSASARPPAKLGWIDANPGGRRRPVAMTPPDAWSLRDMHGNVAEWCRDGDGPHRSELAMRKGSAVRNADDPFLRINNIGFRLVLVRSPPSGGTPPAPDCKIASARQP